MDRKSQNPDSAKAELKLLRVSVLALCELLRSRVAEFERALVDMHRNAATWEEAGPPTSWATELGGLHHDFCRVDCVVSLFASLADSLRSALDERDDLLAADDSH